MGRRRAIMLVGLLCLSVPVKALAQWGDPKLIAGQIGFNVALSFLGKVLLEREPPRRAIEEALKEGSMSGLVAHAGYSIGGRNPEWALVGKALAQKSILLTRRSMNGEPVFDETLWTHWELTHSFVHIKWSGEAPSVQIDAVNTAFSTYYLLAGDPYRLDTKRSLLSGSLVFDNLDAPDRVRGYYVPGTIWVGVDHRDDRHVLGHEIIHSFQVERGSAISEWQVGAFRINWLSFASGVPALLAGWPEHDNRIHEIEADFYSRTAR